MNDDKHFRKWDISLEVEKRNEYDVEDVLDRKSGS